ncbi:MAG: DUF1735 domain-containing protein [Duncaniella sp.]|nr:DUF1735 domain-containing protein [Duncaniella sp.]
MNKSLLILAAAALAMTGCHNSEIEFDNFEHQTISFATQTPVRTITLGDDGDLDQTDDNAHIFYIKAVLGGVNVNTKTHSAAFKVDNSLCDGVSYSNGSPVLPMPAEYYSLSGDQMVIKPGEVIGGVKVQLTDAFFNDPRSVETTYVVPVVLTSSADSILEGKAKDGVLEPRRLVADDWSVKPKDYVLYAVKYKNPYHGCWLSKGTDVTEHNGQTKTDDRNADYWEKASLRYLVTKSLTQSVYKFRHTVPCIDATGKKSEKTLACDLILDIDANGTCTVSTESTGCTASGQGKWTRKGEPKAWGDKDRDLLTLSYTYSIDYVYDETSGRRATYKVTTDEKMVMRDRQNRFEEFTYTVQ